MASTPVINPDLLPPEYLQVDISGRLIAATTTILVVDTILLSLRGYILKLPNAKSGLEDLLLIPAYLLLVGICVVGYLAVEIGGAGRHIEAVVSEDPDTLIRRGKLLYAICWLSAFSNGFSRVSVLVLLRRIFIPGLTRTITNVVIAYIVLYTVSQGISAVTLCRPLAYFWDRTLDGSCINEFLFWQITAVLNVAGDVSIMLLPVKMVWTLHASFAKRCGIAVVFLSSSIGLVASCFRTALFFHARGFHVDDPTLADVSLITWTIVESGMYTAAASCIRLRPLLRVIPTWFGKVAGTSERFERSGLGPALTGHRRPIPQDGDEELLSMSVYREPGGHAQLSSKSIGTVQVVHGDERSAGSWSSGSAEREPPLYLE
ncbi:hypothetical protein BDV06DRAFT_228424 [Aspergillus oleicola]